MAEADLLRQHADVLFRTDAAGRLVALNEPDGEAPPRLFLGRGRTKHVVRFRSDVSALTVDACLRLCALLPPWDGRPADSSLFEPLRLALGGEALIAVEERGSAFLFGERVDPPVDAEAASAKRSLLSIIPGLMAAGAIVYAVRHLERPKERHTAPIRLVVRPLLHGALGRLLVGVSLFEVGNMAATLLILRATELLTPERGQESAVALAVTLYVGHNVAGTVAAIPAGRIADRVGARAVFAVGVALFAVAYALFAIAGPNVAILGAAFVLAGVAIGAVETGENAAVASLAPGDRRGSAFGLLAGIQSMGDFVASAFIGILWTVLGPSVAFGVAVAGMLASLASLVSLGPGEQRPSDG